MLTQPLRIGGEALIVLRAPPIVGRPSFVEATILPGRGFMLLQAKIALACGHRIDVLAAPEAREAASVLDGGTADFAGNGSFSFGGAILAPFANRIRGRPVGSEREIETLIDGVSVRLPRNWGGKAPGAETYAMHGLILAAPVSFVQPRPSALTGRLTTQHFGDRWPGEGNMAFHWRLVRGALVLSVQATSLGPETLPVGIGWHPYFRIQSGSRHQARLRVPADRRVAVNNYDEVLPTGELLDVNGTAYDFRARGGRALGDLYLDDCFTGLATSGRHAEIELLDPAAGLALRVAARAPPVTAVQVYAPPDADFVVIEPQFNLADPYGSQWPSEVSTGMQRLHPGSATRYDVLVSATTLGQGG